MVPRVKDNNLLGMQKAVSLDFDEEQVREGRQEKMLCFQSKLFKVNIINFNYDHIIFIYFDEKIPYNIGTYVYKKTVSKLFGFSAGFPRFLKYFWLCLKLKFDTYIFVPPFWKKARAP